MSHILKFRVGERVRVIADMYAVEGIPHDLEIGEVYEIVEAVRESREGDWASNYQEYLLSGDEGSAWVREDEIEAE